MRDTFCGICVQAQPTAGNGECMKFRVPNYYREFKCIAGDCQNSCCIGWEVDIDEDTSEYYKSVKGSFGERLRQHLQSEDEMEYFALEKNGRCPFLNQEKLCDICIELGEEALSEVCTEYPRFVMEYENVREKILSLSCEEVGRIVFSKDEKMTWEEWEIPGELSDEEDAEAEDGMTEAADAYEVTAEQLEAVRARAVEILQDRNRPIWERAAEYLRYCSKMQQELYLAADDAAVAGDTAMEAGTGCLSVADSTAAGAEEAYRTFLKRMESFEKLEILDETWIQVKKELMQTFSKENYLKARQEYLATESFREYEYEHLFVYFTFRYFMRAYYDANILEKAQFAVLSVLMIRDMDVACYLLHGQQFGMQNRIDTARIYSREVEHSEENMELLAEDIRFEKEFCVENLIRQL